MLLLLLLLLLLLVVLLFETFCCRRGGVPLFRFGDDPACAILVPVPPLLLPVFFLFGGVEEREIARLARVRLTIELFSSDDLMVSDTFRMGSFQDIMPLLVVVMPLLRSSEVAVAVEVWWGGWCWYS